MSTGDTRGARTGRALILWIDPAGRRYFRVPDGLGLAPGELKLHALSGETRRVDLAAVASFGVAAAQAQDEIDQAVEGAFEQVLGALALLLGIEVAAAGGDWTLEDLDTATVETRIQQLSQMPPEALAAELDGVIRAVGRLGGFMDCLPIGHEVAKTIGALFEQLRPALDMIEQARAAGTLPVEELFALLAVLATFDETTGPSAGEAVGAQDGPTRMETLGAEIRAEIESQGAARAPVSWDFADLMKPRAD